MAQQMDMSAEAIRATAKDVREGNSRLKDWLQNLEENESFVNRMWDGQANDEFHAAFLGEYDGTIADFSAAMDKYWSKLLEAARNIELSRNREVNPCYKRYFFKY